MPNIPFLLRFRNAASSDPNWIAKRRGPYLLLPAAALVLLFALLSAGCTIYAATYRKPEGAYNDISEDNPGFIGFYASLRFIPVFLELIHLPLHIRAFLARRLRPAGAVTACSLMFLAWLAYLVGFMGLFEDLSGEWNFYMNAAGWRFFVVSRAAVVCALCLVYLAYFGYACHAAVLRYKRVRRERGSPSVKGGVDEEAGGAVELRENTGQA